MKYSVPPMLTLAILFALVPPCPALPTVAPSAKYAHLARELERFIAHEVADKDLPALSIALVDDQTMVWARGFGFANPQEKVRASAETVYRVGSISKLFT